MTVIIINFISMFYEDTSFHSTESVVRISRRIDQNVHSMLLFQDNDHRKYFIDVKIDPNKLL